MACKQVILASHFQAFFALMHIGQALHLLATTPPTYTLDLAGYVGSDIGAKPKNKGAARRCEPPRDDS